MLANKTTATDSLARAFIYIFICLFTLACLIPFWLVYIGSVTWEPILAKGLTLFPSELSLDAYKFLFKGSQVWRSGGVSILVTAVGTLVAVLVTSMYAYVVAHRKVKYRNFLAFYIYIPMLFTPGLVSYYLLVSNWLSLKNSIWALVLPMLFSSFNSFLMTSFYRTLPFELNEAAAIDGAHETYIFFRIIWNVSLPMIATITLFYALAYWNDWFNALLFMDHQEHYPLQMMIRQVVANAQFANSDMGSNVSANIITPLYGIQLATVVVTIGPIIFLYPFLQRYFIQGITVGSVKG